MRIRTAIVMLTICVSAGAVVWSRHREPPPRIDDAPVTRGDVRQTVKATGTLTPVTTVDVGTQVTGTITRIGADFNSLVTKGQVLAEIDPQPFRIALEGAEAVRLKANDTLAADQATLAEDEREADRQTELFTDHQESAEDHDTAALAVDAARLQVAQDEQVIRVDDAAVSAARDNLAHCEITAPVSGVVLDRDVDVGETVNARVSAPTLFKLATNLRELQVPATIDEADLPEVQPGDPTFIAVDAYPGRAFPGDIKQVRLDASTVNNVVTYPAIISVPNPSLRLLPGMTATITITAGVAKDTLRVPLAALRFRPSDDALRDFQLARPRADTGPLGLPGPGPHTIWVRDGASIAPRRVMAGLSDGQFIAVTPIGGDALTDRDRVVTAIVTADEAARPAARQGPINPFAQPRFRGRRF